MPKKTLAAALVAAAMSIGAPATALPGGNGGGAAAAAPGKAKESQEGPLVPKVLREIAECESGSDPTAVSADGQYRGKYMFLRSTWRAWGGEGDPAAAPEAEQDRRAIKLYRDQGIKPWPACGRAATA